MYLDKISCMQNSTHSVYQGKNLTLTQCPNALLKIYKSSFLNAQGVKGTTGKLFMGFKVNVQGNGSPVPFSLKRRN